MTQTIIFNLADAKSYGTNMKTHAKVGKLTKKQDKHKFLTWFVTAPSEKEVALRSYQQYGAKRPEKAKRLQKWP
jgi:hypothetical protein